MAPAERSKIMECPCCREQLDDITITNNAIGFCSIVINNKYNASFFVCTSRDCKNCGIVTCIPWDMTNEK